MSVLRMRPRSDAFRSTPEALVWNLARRDASSTCMGIAQIMTSRRLNFASTDCRPPFVPVPEMHVVPLGVPRARTAS